MTNMFFHQWEMKRKISHYESEIQLHKREIERIDGLLKKEQHPGTLYLQQRRKALEKEIEYAELQISKFRRLCLW